MMSPTESAGGIYSITTPKTTESSVHQPTKFLYTMKLNNLINEPDT